MQTPMREVTSESQPVLPERIRGLDDLAHDLWWSWNRRARSLFRRLDYKLWRATAHNPVRMLRIVPRARLDRVARDPVYLALYDTVLADLARARANGPTWWSRLAPERADATTAYFSAEFAFHQSLPIYAGGLGVLAGDHCKEASDLGIPLVGVGFMYPQGYFKQRISADGLQEEAYVRLDWGDAPVVPAALPDGRRCTVEVPLGDRTIHVACWLLRLGRTTVYLLDTDLEANAPWDRGLTAKLYGGDRETRIQQEIVLGLGGVRLLRALNISPAVWHLNEGHAGFVVLQRIHDAIAAGRTFENALAQVRRTTVFTTHTPVPAGHDAFPFELVETHLAGAWGALGTNREAFLQLGCYDGGAELFNMTALAMRSSVKINAVSKLHGQVTRRMWGELWPSLPEAEKPIGSITNGIHLPTWVAHELVQLLEPHLGPEWREHQDEQAYWDRLSSVPDEEVWKARQALRRYLFAFIRERARARWCQDGVRAERMMATGMLLDPDALTVGFARRFTSYKRPELIFRDEPRLIRLLTDPERPMQIVFAGKAHPDDEAGKHHIQRIVARTQDPRFAGRIAFIGDYDVHVARFLVQGCDIWLNTPRKPLEASGTSGMKAAVNGVPNLSIADGWWAEGYTGSNGWSIEGTAGHDDLDAADEIDSNALYDLLEQQVVPRFYDRDDHGVPRAWVSLVKESIRTVAPRFSIRRMLKEYATRGYATVPLAEDSSGHGS